MTCRSVLLAAALITRIIPSPDAAVAEDHVRPNIVFILADDLGYGDLACFGRTDIRTPRLDAMAQAGARFTAHYANGAECSPTRAAFLTGRYQQWIGGLECALGTGNVGRYDDAVRLRETHELGLPPEIPTLPRLLQKVGYRTGLFGKWHLGYEPRFAPGRHGFDEAWYCVGGEMDYFHYIDNSGTYNLFHNGTQVRDSGYFTDRMTDKALAFIRESDDRPWFLYLPYTCPHAPFQGPDDQQPEPLAPDSPLWKQSKAPPDVYRSMIEQMDRQIGRVLDAVDENTLVIFAGDNGGTASADNGPFRGIKGTTFEGGIRVPSIAVWPGRITPGTVCDTPTMTFDWTRTIADAAGAEFPEDHPSEGINLLHVLDGNAPDRTLFWRKPRGSRVWRAVRDGHLKYVAEQNNDTFREFLFDLSADPAESRNLAEQHPEQTRRLRDRVARWESETRSERRGQTERLWQTNAARDEIRPAFTAHPDGSLSVSADDRPGLAGWWSRDFPVAPDTHLEFSAACIARGLNTVRREAVARIVWLSADGRPVYRGGEASVVTLPGGRARAEPEFPAPVIVPQSPSATGRNQSVHVSGIYRVPKEATTARVELHLRWGPPGASVTWSDIQLEPVPEPEPRLVRIAAVHYRPETGRTNDAKCRQFAPFIEEAGEQKVDLIVLPETLTFFSSGRSYAECAEPVPGPSTEYFGRLADEHNLYIVAGLLERDGHLIYNTAVLLGPDGSLIGRYRKVSLPRGEIEGGLTPGTELPVFRTRFGTLGMMICYDGFFPEVAQGLSDNGAEIIAWPVWGCNPLLASARACENHVFIASSTYTSADQNWIRTAIYDRQGRALSAAEEFGTLAVTEVDLNQPLHWQSLGDFKAQLPAHRPVIGSP